MSHQDENAEFNYLNPMPIQETPPNHQPPYVSHYSAHPRYAEASAAFLPFVEPQSVYAGFNYPNQYQSVKPDHHPHYSHNPGSNLNSMYQNGNYETTGPITKERGVGSFPVRTFSGNNLLADNSNMSGRSLRRLNTEMPISDASNFCDFGTYDPFQGSPVEITNLGLHENRSSLASTVDQSYAKIESPPVKTVQQEIAEIPPESSSVQQQEQREQQQQSKRSYKDVLTFPTRSESPSNGTASEQPVKPKVDNETRKETYKEKLLSTNNAIKTSTQGTQSQSQPAKAQNLNNHRSQPNMNPKKPLKINNNLTGSVSKSASKSSDKNWHSHNESVRSVRSQTDLGGVKKRIRPSLISSENVSFELPPSGDEEDDDQDDAAGSFTVEVRAKEKNKREVRPKAKEKENDRVPSGSNRRNPHKRNSPPNASAAFARAYLPKVVRVCGWFCVWLYNLCADVLRMSWDLLLAGAESCHSTLSEKGWLLLNWLQGQWRRGRHYAATQLVPPLKDFFRFFRRQSQHKDDGTPSGGLNASIPLPTTGEEAMHRLLACKGRDPYSILGVRRDSSDEEIRRYYKRQAVLVHPDKNRQRGAEEAFKILAHAFELIGQPDRRSRYDQLVQEADEMETAWAELNQLLSRLHAKMDEAANTIRCTNCSKRHRRLKTDRPCYAARYCQDCKIHHSAREGDLWAESRYMGLRSKYFACMEGAVYDITDWANCQAGHLRHLQSNSHRVQYRIVPGQGQPGHHGPGRSKSSS